MDLREVRCWGSKVGLERKRLSVSDFIAGEKESENSTEKRMCRRSQQSVMQGLEEDLISHPILCITISSPLQAIGGLCAESQVCMMGQVC